MSTSPLLFRSRVSARTISMVLRPSKKAIRSEISPSTSNSCSQISSPRRRISCIPRLELSAPLIIFSFTSNILQSIDLDTCYNRYWLGYRHVRAVWCRCCLSTARLLLLVCDRSSRQSRKVGEWFHKVVLYFLFTFMLFRIYLLSISAFSWILETFLKFLHET